MAPNPQPLSGEALMALYDRAERVPPASLRAVLAAGFGADDPTALRVGDAERLLWAAKCAQFGAGTLSEFSCDSCGDGISFAVPEGFALPDRVSDEASVEWNGARYVLALPTLGDVAAGAVFEAVLPGGPWADAGFRAAAAVALDAADGAMDVVFDVACPECGNTNARAFDPAAFLWADLEEFAGVLFHEVAILARAFGWSEAETLALTPARRARYVEMVA